MREFKMKTLKLVKSNILSIISIKTIIYVILIFIAINYINYGIYSINNLDDVIKSSFYGVNKLSDSTVEIFKMLLINIFPIYITLNYFNVTIDNYNLFTLMRMDNKASWINSLFISTLIFCILYYVIGFIVLFILNFKLMLVIFNFKYCFEVLILLVLSSFSICLVSMLLNSLIKNKSLIFSLIIFLYLLSIVMGDSISDSDKWLIFNQSMLVKYTYSCLTFYWAYFFNIITSCTLCFFIKIRVINKN